MIPAIGRVLGVDLGSRRIGVAVTDSGQRVATGVTTLHRRPDPVEDHRALAALAADYEAVGVVVGLPVSLSGRLGPAAQGVLAEVAAMQASLGVEVETVDERLTTRAAADGLRATGQYGLSGPERDRPERCRGTPSELGRTPIDRSWTSE